MVTPAKRKRARDEGVLVRHAPAMASVLRRIHNNNDAVVFYNEQGTFKLMLRNDPIDDDTLACELAIVTEEEDGLARIFDFLNDGYVDEPNVYVMDSWSFPAKGFGTEDAAKVMAAVNEAYLYRVCPCAKYLIKDDAPMCTFCDMTSTSEDRDSHFCSICCDDGLAMHMTTMPCCSQRLHQRCLDTWAAKSRDDRCPLCRQKPPA